MKKFYKNGIVIALAIVFVFGLVGPITAHASGPAINGITNTLVTPSTYQYTTFKGVPVYELNITNSGSTDDTLVSLAPTPVGNVVDTLISLHFYNDVNNNGIVDQGDTDLHGAISGGAINFHADNTKDIFALASPLAIPSGGVVTHILITADGGPAVGNAQTLTLSFALSTDVQMGTVQITPAPGSNMPNSGVLTISNTAPSIAITNGASDPIAKTVAASATGVAVKRLTFTAQATSDSIVSLAMTPGGNEDDAANIASTKFYIDSGDTPGAIDGTDIILSATPTKYSTNNVIETFTFLSPILIPGGTPGTAVNILYTYNLGAGVIGGRTLTAQLVATTDAVTGSGLSDVSNSSGISSTITIADTTPPTVTITSDKTTLTKGQTAAITFTLSASSTNFATGDATVAGGTISAISGSGTSYTATFTPTAESTTLATIDVAGSTFTNSSGTNNTAATQKTMTVNTVTPSTGGGGGGGGTPPLIDLVKIPNPLALPNGPGLVTYTYLLRNIGTVPVANITMVGDSCSPILLGSGDVNADLKLDLNETWIYRCSTTLTKTHTNTVVATGWGNGISTVDIASSTVVVGVLVVPPLIHITKIPNVFTLSAPGGAVTYTYTVTNPGTAPLSNVGITDDKCSNVKYISGDTNIDSKIDFKETWIYTCQINLIKTTTNTVTAVGSANGLTAKDFAITTVVVTEHNLSSIAGMASVISSGFGQTVKMIVTNLNVGSKGDFVKTLQQYLISQDKGSNAKALGASGTTTNFGPLTRAALAEWQKAVGIVPALGNFGPITRAYLKAH